jgi:hypothetical protein
MRPPPTIAEIFAEFASLYLTVTRLLDEATAVMHSVLAQAGRLAAEPPHLRTNMIPGLVIQARSAGVDAENEILAAAGYASPAEYWTKLDQPMPVERLALLLASHLTDPEERIVWQPSAEGRGPTTFDSRTAVHRRVEAALGVVIAAGFLETFEHNGKRCLRSPRTAVEGLLRSPTNEDLVPPSLASVLRPVKTGQVIKEKKAPAAMPRALTPRSEIKRWLQDEVLPNNPNPTHDEVFEAAREKFGHDRVTRKLVVDGEDSVLRELRPDLFGKPGRRPEPGRRPPGN